MKNYITLRWLRSSFDLNNNNLINNSRGQSLIQAVVAIGILAIIASTFTSMMVAQNREIKAISEKLAISDMSQTLNAALGDGSVCSQLLNPPGKSPLTFNAKSLTDNPQVIAVPSLYASYSLTAGFGPPVAEVGHVPPGFPYEMSVTAIKLYIDQGPTPVPSAATVTFLGHWQVEFSSQAMVRALHPASHTVILTADTTNPANSIITSCTSADHGMSGKELVSTSCNDPAQSVPNKKIIPTTAESFCAVKCPAGKMVIAGGGTASDGYISMSGPGSIGPAPALYSINDKGWVVGGAGPILGPWSCGGWNSCRIHFNAWALCANR